MQLRLAMLALLSIAVAMAGCRRKEDTVASGGVVSMTPSATDVLLALGLQDRLVARDRYSEQPEVRDLPVVGDFVQVNVEAVANLHPELVILDHSQERARQALEALNISVLTLPMHTLSDVNNALEVVGARLAVLPAAHRAQADLATAIQEAQKRRVPGTAPRVLLVIDRPTDRLSHVVAAGPNTYLDELCTLAGARNVLEGSQVPYPKVSMAHLLRVDPDVVIDLSRAEGGLELYRQTGLRAAMQARVHLLDEPSLARPSPFVRVALERLAQLTTMQGAH